MMQTYGQASRIKSIADLAEGIYAAGTEALTSYNTTVTDYATQFGVFVHDEGKRINKTTGVTETYKLRCSIYPRRHVKELSRTSETS